MTNEEYQNTQIQLQMIGEVVSRLDLAGFLNRIDRAETMGPILDPTLYRRAALGLDKIQTLARAAYAFQRAVKPLYKGGRQ